MTKLIFLRHGQSISHTLSGDDRIVKDEENALTHNGEKEVAQVAEFLCTKYSPVTIYASPIRRALETALILSKTTNQPIIFDDRLREREFNFPESLTANESIQLQQQSHANPRVAYSNGETVEKHRCRVQEWFDEFVTSIEDDRTYIIVTHGGTIDHLQAILFNTSIDAMSNFFVSCDPAHYHHWTFMSLAENRKVWRLDEVNAFRV